METKTQITVENTIKAPVSKVWKFWNAPEHITQWCQASAIGMHRMQKMIFGWAVSLKLLWPRVTEV